MGKLTICVDFKGTLEDSGHIPVGKKFGPPQPGAEDVAEDLIQGGHKVIVFTTIAANPSGRQAVEDWLEYFDIPYTGVTAVKPEADLYIDNKAVYHKDWGQTVKEINRRLGLDLDEVG